MSQPVVLRTYKMVEYKAKLRIELCSILMTVSPSLVVDMQTTKTRLVSVPFLPVPFTESQQGSRNMMEGRNRCGVSTTRIAIGCFPEWSPLRLRVFHDSPSTRMHIEYGRMCRMQYRAPHQRIPPFIIIPLPIDCM